MVAKSQYAGCVFHIGKLSYDLKAKSISDDAFLDLLPYFWTLLR